MELTILIIVATLFCLIGVACVVAVVLGLPGTWIMLALALVIELVDGSYLTPDASGATVTFGWGVLAIGVGLAALGEVLEFIAGALGAKSAGSSRAGMVGALIGGLVGAIAGLPFLPPLGSLFGAFAGTFVGAVIGEMQSSPQTAMRDTLKPATGATIGRILGTLSKLPLAFIVWLMLSVAAFWP